MTDAPQLRIATPSSFAPKTEQVQLPSQKGTEECVLLRRPDIIALVSGEGDVPDILTNLMLSSINASQPSEMAIDADNLPQVFESMDHICKVCFVQPKLGDKDTEDAEYMPVSWLSFTDRTFVFEWALGAQYEAASSFRPESDADVDVVQQVPDVPAGTKRRNRSTG